MSFQAEFEFNLPKGYVDKDGNLNKEGTMRLATAADEILPLKDPKVQANPAYLTIILFSRVITRLGNLQDINTKVIEGLFASDLKYLQDFYHKINDETSNNIMVVCPKCDYQFVLEGGYTGE